MARFPSGFGHSYSTMTIHLPAAHPCRMSSHDSSVANPGRLAVDIDDSRHSIFQIRRSPRGKRIHREIEQIHVTVSRDNFISHSFPLFFPLTSVCRESFLK